MKRSEYPRKLKKAVNSMRATEYKSVPYWGRRSRRRTKWVVRGELEFWKLYREIERKDAMIKRLQATLDYFNSLTARL